MTRMAGLRGSMSSPISAIEVKKVNVIGIISTKLRCTLYP